MWLFLVGLMIGGAGAAVVYWRARREALRIDEERQVVTQETLIVVEFMHHMAEALALNPRREDLYQRIVHASILCTGATSACVFEPLSNGMLRGAAVEGLFPPQRPIDGEARSLGLSRAGLIERVLRSERIVVGEGVVGQVAGARRGELISDTTHDDRVVTHGDPALEMRSMIAVPLIFADQFYGVLAVVNPADGMAFTEMDFSLVQSLSEQAALALRHAEFLHFQLEKNQLDLDLSLASSVQQMLLPREAPTMDGFDVSMRYAPAQKVSGDFYDVFSVSETKLAVAVGDVSGKGVAASLLMAICRTHLRQIAPRFESPARVLCELQRILANEIKRDMFITLIYAVVDTEYDEVLFSRAGHELPLFGHVDRVTGNFAEQFVRSEGMAIGLVDEALFGEVITDQRMPLRSGDSFVLYTDGITEAANAAGEEFTGSRLAEVIRKHHSETAAQISDAIELAVKQFVGDTPPRDDATLVTVKRV
ncbi:MAG: SpoIIE family protein phosphatase [Opitutaceae bacterium]|nr:SpoIIE family protein phosphatase [Opitutaceae bacterium]